MAVPYIHVIKKRRKFESKRKRDSVMEKRMLTAHKYIDSGCNPPNKYWEQTISSNVCCVPLRVIFVFVFILQRSLMNSGPYFECLFLFTII